MNQLIQYAKIKEHRQSKFRKDKDNMERYNYFVRTNKP